ncbi:diguanylate cyclase [Xenophilus sp. Marseille-Q4582]|uniref:diguanylate cyclase n=1 Tax=Xenophilus sp. Marseille-Q4582 TaxID=2866600 RepID=UPI001CE482FA|nr:diguanylate cyclase [Xenophilus sp. Marseille-Q4582]
MSQGVPTFTPDTAEPSQPSVRVLLVDDQAIVGVILRTILATDPDIEVQTCQQAGEAVALARQLQPTVILQDLLMPGMDGLDLVRAYRDTPETRDVPIIVLSANDDPLMKRASFSAGANDYLVKLPEPIELTARIRYHSRSYRTLLERNSAYEALHASRQALLQRNDELRRLTQLDGLTGVSNRRYFDERFAQEWTLAALEGTELALLMIDVDYFKAYNDHFGHLAGDAALQGVATVIRQVARAHEGVAARFGGEEFALVAPRTSSAQARAHAEAVRSGVQQLRIAAAPASPHAALSVSIGAGALRADAFTLSQDLIQLADSRLYAAKRQGRNCVVAD